MVFPMGPLGLQKEPGRSATACQELTQECLCYGPTAQAERARQILLCLPDDTNWTPFLIGTQNKHRERKMHLYLLGTATMRPFPMNAQNGQREPDRSTFAHCHQNTFSYGNALWVERARKICLCQLAANWKVLPYRLPVQTKQSDVSSTSFQVQPPEITFLLLHSLNQRPKTNEPLHLGCCHQKDHSWCGQHMQREQHILLSLQAAATGRLPSAGDQGEQWHIAR